MGFLHDFLTDPSGYAASHPDTVTTTANGGGGINDILNTAQSDITTQQQSDEQAKLDAEKEKFDANKKLTDNEPPKTFFTPTMKLVVGISSFLLVASGITLLVVKLKNKKRK